MLKNISTSELLRTRPKTCLTIASVPLLTCSCNKYLWIHVSTNYFFSFKIHLIWWAHCRCIYWWNIIYIYIFQLKNITNISWIAFIMYIQSQNIKKPNNFKSVATRERKGLIYTYTIICNVKFGSCHISSSVGGMFYDVMYKHNSLF